MKIISWNCGGKFREKYSIIEKENADIYVIQECENPESYNQYFTKFSSDYVWQGDNSKGLGIFVKSNITMSVNDWPAYCLRHFISVKINNDFDLLGVWAGPPYIAEYFVYQYINFDKFDANTLIIGDFNSNAIWDKTNKKRNHSDVVTLLKTKDIVSAYHYTTGEEEGQETQRTFHLYRHKDKCYHIDYCFVKPERIKDFKILNNEEWLLYSDHLPIQIVI